MKATSFFLVLYLSMHALSAQTTIPVDSFLGVKFGSAPETAILLIQNAGGTADIKNTKKSVYAFSNVPYGSRIAESVYLMYSNNKLFEARAYFRAEPQQQALLLYQRIKNDVSLKYGEGTDVRRFSDPYSEGDGNELTAIELGKATYSTSWVEDKVNGKYNNIELLLNSDLYISLKFTDVKTLRTR